MADCCRKVPIMDKRGKTHFVPCGKCENCLSNKQNDFLVRAYRAGIYYGNMHLLTLTYDDEHLPISGCVASFVDNEVDWHYFPFLLDSSLREVFFSGKHSSYVSCKGQKCSFIPPHRDTNTS